MTKSLPIFQQYVKCATRGNNTQDPKKPSYKGEAVKGVTEALQDCFEYTDWDVLTQPASLEDVTDVVTEYIKSCEENIVPSKAVKIFSNNKPWITKELKTTINEKKIAFN